MKLTLLLLLLTVLSGIAADTYSQTTKLTLKLENVRIEDLLSQIEDKSEFRFFYNEEINLDKKVSVNSSDETLVNILDKIFHNTGIRYEMVGRQVILTNSVNGIASASQPSKTVTGKVTDSFGQSLPGVSVVIKGTTNGIITDSDGNYKLLNVPEDATLVFSFVGMKSQEITVSGKASINVKLEEETYGIEEVVAIGYGTMKKSDLTGSVSTIDVNLIKNLPVTTIDQKMIGQTSGVQIQQVSGAPGAGTSIKIRGIGSIGAGNEPLYVIDGIPYSSGMNFNLNPLVYINPNDIESISILKDASSTAIYGSRGANGVIIITTKKGNIEQTEVSVSAMSGIQQVPENSRPKMMNATDFALYQQDMISKKVRALENREATIDDFPLEYRYPDQLGEGFNFYDLILRPALVQDYNISILKGAKESQLNFSMGYYNQNGVLRYTGLERFTAKISGESNLGKVVKIGFSLMPTFIKQDRTDTNKGRNDIISTSLWANPVVSPYAANGDLLPYLQSPNNKYTQPWSLVNPLFSLRETIQNQKVFNNIGSTFIEWKFAQNFNIKSYLSTIWMHSDYFQYVPSTIGGNNKPPTPGTGYSYTTTDNSFNWLLENTLTYNNTLRNHSLNAIVGYTVQENTNNGINLLANPYSNDMIQTINAAQAIKTWGEDYNQWALISYLGRINYSYKDKYLLTATFRSDGSSRFGYKNRFAFFPSFAAAWRLSEEKIIKNLKAIDNLKLRFSYGKSGNDNIGNYRRLSSINAGSYVFNNKQVNASYVGISNPFLTWEESEQFDAGFDIGFFNERLSFVFDIYQRKSINMLLDDVIPAITGFNSQTVNKGNIRNSGIEVALNGTPISGKLNWNINLNFSFNKNKVISLNEKGDRIISGSNWGFPTHVTYVGKPMTQFFGFVFDGLLTAEDMVNTNVVKDKMAHEGGNKYKDINGDGVITDIIDYDIIGSPFPNCIYGLTNTLSYSGFDLSFIINGQIGGQIIDSRRSETDFLWGKTNLRKEWVNRWISPEQPGDGKHSGVTTASENWTWKVNSTWVEDATFLRISNIKLNYTLPKRWIKATNIIRNCNVYFTIQNLATFTSYRGANPEAQASSVSNTMAPGWDSSPYPLARTSSLGINIIF